MENAFDKLNKAVTNSEGYAGDAATQTAAMKGGLEILFERIIEMYAAEPDDDEEEDLAGFETWKREPGHPIKEPIHDFDERCMIAKNTGKLDFSY